MGWVIVVHRGRLLCASLRCIFLTLGGNSILRRIHRRDISSPTNAKLIPPPPPINLGQAKYQDRLFEFRGQKKPVIKPPPAVDQSMGVGDGSAGGGLERRPSLSQGMTEYIGFVNIVLVRGEELVPSGFGQVREEKFEQQQLQQRQRQQRRRQRRQCFNRNTDKALESSPPNTCPLTKH